MSITKFLHISDLHFGVINNAYGIIDLLKIFSTTTKLDKFGFHTSYDLLKLLSLVEDVIENEDEKEIVDFILITGDISTSASNEDLKLSSKLLTTNISNYPYEIVGDHVKLEVDLSKIENNKDKELYKKVLDSLAKTKIISHKNLILLPGNHDRLFADYTTYTTSLFLTNNDFETFFNPLWNPIKSDTKRIHYHSVKINNSEKKFLFIKIDCSHYNKFLPLTEVGTGEFSLEIEEDLKNILNKVFASNNAENYVPIITLHFLPSMEVKWTLALSRWKNLLSLLKTYKIKYIFCGHTHHEKIYTIGNLTIFCSSSTLATKDKHSRVNVFKYDSINSTISIDKHYYWEKKFFKFMQKV